MFLVKWHDTDEYLQTILPYPTWSTKDEAEIFPTREAAEDMANWWAYKRAIVEEIT